MNEKLKSDIDHLIIRLITVSAIVLMSASYVNHTKKARHNVEILNQQQIIEKATEIADKNGIPGLQIKELTDLLEKCGWRGNLLENIAYELKAIYGDKIKVALGQDDTGKPKYTIEIPRYILEKYILKK